MRSWTFVISVVVHLAAFGIVAWQGRTPSKHKGTEVSVVSKPKKAAEPKPEEDKPKPPPPPPPPRAPKVATPAPAHAAPPPAAAPAPAPSGPRVSTGLTLSNGPGGGGIAVGSMSNGPVGKSPVGPPTGDEKPQRLTPPPPKEADACDAADTKPRPMGTVTVEYPDKARAEGVEGRIQVRIHVGEDGAVTEVEVVEGVDPSLDAAVIAALKTWRFTPATHCGRPSPGVLAWAQRFELGD